MTGRRTPKTDAFTGSGKKLLDTRGGRGGGNSNEPRPDQHDA